MIYFNLMAINTIPELLRQSWNQYKMQGRVLLKVAVLYFLVNSIQLMPVVFISSKEPWFPLLDQVLFWISLLLTSWISVVLIRQVASGSKTFEEKIFSMSLDQAGAYFLLTVISIAAFFGGIALFLIPGLLLLIWMSLAGYVLVLEKKGVVASVYASRLYLWNRGWPVAVRLSVVMVPYFFFGVIPMLIPFGPGNLALQTIMSLAVALFLPLETIYLYLIYQQVKKETSLPEKEVSGWFKFLFVTSSVIGLVIFGLVFIGSLLPTT